MILIAIARPSAEITVDIQPVGFFEAVGAGSGTTAGTLTATPTGGFPPYDYAWEVVSTTFGMDIDTPTMDETAFVYVNLNTFLDTEYAVVKCTVTDSQGNFGAAASAVTIIRTS